MDFRKSNRHKVKPTGTDALQNDKPITNDLHSHAKSELEPQTKKSSSRKHSLLTSKKTFIPATIIIVAMISWISLQPTQPKKSSTTNNITVPLYQTVLPNNKSIAELGGWKRISPPKNDPVFAYSDTLGGVSIIVSQQPLPQSFNGSVADQVAEIAKGYNATNKLDSEDTSVFVGTSAKGPQSVIFTKKNLLVLIMSQGKIENKVWIDYVKNLIIQDETLPKF
ncbi:MAG: hypothetical protein WAW80_04585 [Candidatus Saccharimonadales bacterium]